MTDHETVNADAIATEIFSAYEQFSSEGDLEKDGKWFTIGTMEFKLSRAGGNNTEFLKMLRKHVTPLKRLIDAGHIVEKQSQAALAKVFAGCIVKDWRNVYGRDRVLLPYSKENCITLLTDLPNLLLELNKIVDNFDNFRKADLEADAKN
jgi:hypothetical protein